MDIAGKARKLERRITRTVDAAVDGAHRAAASRRRSRSCTPCSIAPSSRSRRSAAAGGCSRSTASSLHVVAPPGEKEKRARFAAVVEGPPSLCERLTERLRSAGCAVTDLSAEIVYARQRGAEWERPIFHVEFDRVGARAGRPPAGRRRRRRARG